MKLLETWDIVMLLAVFLENDYVLLCTIFEQISEFCIYMISIYLIAWAHV